MTGAERVTERGPRPVARPGPGDLPPRCCCRTAPAVVVLHQGPEPPSCYAARVPTAVGSRMAASQAGMPVAASCPDRRKRSEDVAVAGVGAVAVAGRTRPVDHSHRGRKVGAGYQPPRCRRKPPRGLTSSLH